MKQQSINSREGQCGNFSYLMVPPAPDRKRINCGDDHRQMPGESVVFETLGRIGTLRLNPLLKLSAVFTKVSEKSTRLFSLPYNESDKRRVNLLPKLLDACTGEESLMDDQTSFSEDSSNQQSADSDEARLPTALGREPSKGSSPVPSQTLPADIESQNRVNSTSAPIDSLSKARDSNKRRHTDSLTQTLTVLATVSLMLLSARYIVPSIVEELRFAWHRGELRAEYQSGRDGLKNVSLDTLSDAYQMVTSAVGPSVAHIDVERDLSDEERSFSRQLFGGGMTPTDQGSGVVVDQDGYVLTNRHVILGGEVITVTLSDGRQLPASIVGSDALTDLALLKIEASDLLPIPWGDSDLCKVGAPVWAVGSPFGLDRTITFGILSGKHRMVRASTQYQDFMQSDVAVNPGNSGGPLVNARGRLIGINTAIVGDTYRGVSFSIPSNVAKQVYQQLRANGRVQRGWLGVKLDDIEYDPNANEDPLLRGALVDYLTDPQSPAAMAGMKAGDRIRKVNGKRIQDRAHLMREIGSTLVGSAVQIVVERSGTELELSVVLGARPNELNQQ